MISIQLVQDNITTISVDAIVNAANSSLMGGGGVDGAIHRAAGQQLLNECLAIRNQQGGCDIGEAVITNAGLLPAKKVIHTVGPYWHPEKQEACHQLLANCYRNSLAIAEDYQLSTIAFPNISTGIFRFPKDKAADIAINTILSYQYSSLKIVTFVCFDQENYQLYKEKLPSHVE